MVALAYIEPIRGEKPVELTELTVEAEITGMYAQTSQTMVFFNPNSRALEGSLVFPMPEGAVVCGYALDVQGRMVDGVVVPKEEARRILETEIRQGVDPGLVEQVAGNLYRTRVYPLPPGGTRRIRISYVSELTSEGAAAHYHLPLGHGENLEKVQVRLTVHQSPVRPLLSGWEGQQMLQREGCWISEGTLSGRQDHDFHLSLPDLPDLFTQVERTEDNEIFFCVSARQHVSEQREWRPQRLGIVWDASGSRLEHSKELEFLEQLATLWPNTSGQLLVVREKSETPVAFTSISELIGLLQQIPCDGASGLSHLKLDGQVDAWLFFSDGLDTVQPGLPQTASQPVFTVTSQPAHNANLLQLLAEGSQGRFFNLNRWTVAEAVAALSCISRTSPSLDCQGGQQLHRNASQGRLQLLGRLTSENPRALISTGVLEAVQLAQDQAQAGQLLARAWAGREMAALQARNGSPQESLELARRYGLVSQGASLLVLESLEQYLKYEVCPPKSDPQMREAYQRRLLDRQSEKQNQRRSRIETVCGLWARRVKWWETDFSSARQEIKAKKSRPPAAELERGGSGAAPPPPPPCPPIAQAAPAPALRMMAAPLLAAPAGAPAPPPCAEPACFDLGADEGGTDTPGSSPVGSITIKAWDPQTPYLNALRESAPDRAYQTYLRLRPEYAASPSFYLDCADFFLARGQTEIGLRVLSNLLELALDDPALLRIYSWRLQQAQLDDQAVAILERVLPMRPDEPQSYRDLGLALSDRWDRDGRAADAFRAAELLYEVVQREWDRFPEIEVIALMELNRLLHKAGQAGVEMPLIDQRLVKHLDLDLRISMGWDADLTDVDLHVWEPTGDHAYYGAPNSPQGGLVSLDFRQGYGPEEYVLRKAMPGDYEIKAHYYGSHQQTLMGACTVLVTVFTDYGRPQEKRQLLTLRLDKPSQEVSVGKITV
jgi:Ca-activated chloride channel family protein